MPLDSYEEVPAPLADLLGLAACHAAVAAIRLGVFPALQEAPRDLPALAAALAVEPEPLELLLQSLAAVGYVTATDGRYANLPPGEWLCGHWGAVLHLWTAMTGEHWPTLPDAIRTGRPDARFYPWLDERPAHRERFHSLQEGLADGLAEALTLPEGTRTLLDVGGGSGTFSRALCARHPGLHATVVDLPSVIEAAALAGRLTGRPADLAEPGAVTERDRDAVLLCNVVHGFPPARARALIAESAAALRPGGTLLLLESAPTPEAPADRAFQRFFDLNLWHTQGGRLYPVETLAAWMKEAGCVVQRSELQGHPSHVLLTGAR